MTGRRSHLTGRAAQLETPRQRLTGPTTASLAGPGGLIEYLCTGSGDPSTVFAHGLGGTIEATRPFGSGVPGRRTFLHFRGYGASQMPPGVPWSYHAIADDLRAVANHQRATRSVGVSMGAGALCALLTQTPARFERVVLMLPAIIDRPRQDGSRDRLLRLAALSQTGDVPGITQHLLGELPDDHRDRADVRAWVVGHAQALAGAGSLYALRALPHVVPITDRSSLRRVTAQVLVVGQEADPTHPAAMARELATLFPHGRAVILPPGGVLWGHRTRVRALLSEFLA